MKHLHRLQRVELLVFSIVTILNLIPFIATRFFPSMDGASHLANSNIINQLVFHHNALFQKFFTISSEPVPNWTGHLFISLLTLVLPAFLAEKILIIALMTGIPFAFRRLVVRVSPTNHLYSFLVFPFTHSMFLFFGFYNFCIAVLFFLMALNFWLRHDGSEWNVRRFFLFLLLVALTYFSHIVIFGLLVIFIFLQIATRFVASLVCKNSPDRVPVRSLVRQTLILAAAAAVPFLLFVYFFYSRPGTREITFLARKDLIQYLLTVRPLISLNPIIEGKHTSLIFWILCMVCAAGVLWFLYRAVSRFLPGDKSLPSGTGLLPKGNFWWMLSVILVLLALYFKLPDAYGTASYTNLRIGFILFLAVIVWISTFRLPWWIGLLAAAGGLYVNTTLVRYYAPNVRDLGKLASDCNKAADHIEPNTLVLPIYVLDNWFTGHFVDYLAVDKPVVMVYNYECQMGYFPVRWNEKEKPNYFMGTAGMEDRYINFELVKGRPSLPLDYVFVVGQYDPAKDWFFGQLHRILTNDFTKVYSTDNCALYRNKMRK